MYEVVIAGDFQQPFQNQVLEENWLRFLRDFKPNEVVLNGDIVDLPQLSTKFTRRVADLGRTVEDISTLGRFLDRVKKSGAKVSFLPGNHEERWWSYVEEKAPELEGLLGSNLSFPAVGGMNQRGAIFIGRYAEHTARWERDGLVVTHGGFHGKVAALHMLNAEGRYRFRPNNVSTKPLSMTN